MDFRPKSSSCSFLEWRLTGFHGLQLKRSPCKPYHTNRTHEVLHKSEEPIFFPPGGAIETGPVFWAQYQGGFEEKDTEGLVGLGCRSSVIPIECETGRQLVNSD